MNPDDPIHVRLCMADAPLGERVAACLTAAAECVQLVDTADSSRADVVVADHLLESETLAGRVFLGPSSSNGDGFDATLSADFLDRELVALVRLVGRLSRLRRQLADRDVVHRTLRDQALTDPVTGLANRRGWEEGLARTLAVCRRRGLGIAIAVIDLDQFKRINDSLGHAAGDEVLHEVGASLAASLRGGDTLARIGGDEFAVALPGLAAEHANNVVDRIRRSLSRVTLPNPAMQATEHAQNVTASAGYTCASADQLITSADPNVATTLLAAADRAMYRAKEAGRDCTRGG